jgi:hypothetical protein
MTPKARKGYGPLHAIGRARLAFPTRKRLGHAELAGSYYRRFLRRYDRPVQRHLPLVEQARSRMRELAVERTPPAGR